MSRLLIILLISACCISANAQRDSVLMTVNSRLLFPEYQIIIQQGDKYIKETYTYFKYTYWIDKKDTITLSRFTKTASGYIILKKKKPLIYLYYGSCDSVINKIRNSASYWKMESGIDNIVRSKVGYDNKNFQDFKTLNRLPPDIFIKTCNTNYLTIQFDLQQKYLSCIDSLYNDKEQRFIWIKSNQESINQDYIDSFISNFNYSDPDFRSLEVIIVKHPELFLNSVYKLSETDFFPFTLKLDGFPKDIHLSQAKSKLEQATNKNKRKRKVIRKMKNKS